MPLACSRFSFTRMGTIAHSDGCSLFIRRTAMKKETQQKDLYQQITDQIIDALDLGIMAWHKW